MVYAPGTAETDPKKQNRAIQAGAAAVAVNTADIATANTNISTANTNIAANTASIAALSAASYVNTIAGNTGAFTLNSTSGITNATNDIKLQQATASQFGAVKVDNSTIVAASGVLSTGSNVPLLNAANTFTAAQTAPNLKTTSSMANAVVPPHLDTSGQTALSVAAAANGIIATATQLSGVWMCMETAVTGDVAIYAVSNGTLKLVFSVTGNFVAPTTTPAAGKFCPQFDGSTNYRMYNNQGSTCTFKIAFIRLN